MATTEQAKEILRGLAKAITEPEPSKYSFSHGGIEYSITESEITQYIKCKPKISKLTETQLFMPGYYEHAIQFERLGPRGTDVPVSLESHDRQIKIQINKPSSLFCLTLTDTDKFNKDLRRFWMHRSFFISTDERAPVSIRELFDLHTIQISAPLDMPLGRAPNLMHELAEAAAFHFTYGSGIPVSFTKSWARTRYWIGRKPSEQVQFPLRTYNSELVGYYNLAHASDSLFLGYLALYKILEYFYTSASENALHEKVKEHIVSPDFSHTKTKKLRDLVRLIRKFDTRLDEFSALKLVLAEYFDESELRQWIENYEAANSPHFTVDKVVFNNSTKIDTSDNTIIPNIASRIYTIRNALVHNKEGEISRFVPYTGQEEVLQKEVQILLFLAEQLIIKTGKDITW